jgi:hypothetical protein
VGRASARPTGRAAFVERQHRYQESEMPIEIKELHIRVVVDAPTSEAGAGTADFKEFTVKKQTDTPMAGDDAPLEEVSFNFAQAEVQHAGSGPDFQFQADANASGDGRDVLIGGVGADHLDVGNNRGLLLVGVDDVHLKAMFDGFDLV